MSTYKVKLAANVDRFFSTKRVKGIELIEAESYKEAKTKALKLIKDSRRKLAIAEYDSLIDVPEIDIVDIEKVE